MKSLLVAGLLHVVLSSAYLVSTPAFEAPDENDHWSYAWQIANAHRPPVMRFTASGLGRPLVDEAGLAHHPPLYYAVLGGLMVLTGHADTVASPLANPQSLAGTPEGAFVWLHGADEAPPVSSEVRFLRILRFVSVLCGLASLVLTWRLGRLAFPARPAVADAAVLLLATLPAWSFHHAVLDNGNLATTLSHAALLALCAAIASARLDARVAGACGLLLGLCLVTKLTTLALVPLFAVAALLAVRASRQRARALRAVTLGAVVLAAVAGWFFVRNLQLYGDALGGSAHERVYAGIRVPEGQVLPWLRIGFLPNVFASLLGTFGWWTVPPHPTLVTAGKVVAVLGGIGIAVNLLRPRGESRRAVVLVLAGAAALVFLATLHYNLTFRQPQGRYLFPAAGPLAIGLAAGLVRLVAPLRERVRGAVGIGGAAGLVVVALLVHQERFVPAFDRSLVPAPALHASLTAGCTARAGTPGIELAGPPDGARLQAPPTLTWRPLDDPAARYALYVFSPAGRIYFALHEWLRVELQGGEYAVPADVWDSLPRGVELIWNVRRIPDRTRHEEVAEMPAGAGLSFVRVR